MCCIRLTRCSFDDERSGSSALLQLGDTLQSIPEVYEVMITLGGHKAMNLFQEISRSIGTTPYGSASESNNAAVTNLLSIMECHTLGFEFLRLLLPKQDRFHLEEKSVQMVWKKSQLYSIEEIERWGVSFQYLLQSLLYVVELHLTCA